MLEGPCARNNILLYMGINILINFRQSTACEAHNLKVVGSNPTPATKKIKTKSTPYTPPSVGRPRSPKPTWKHCGSKRNHKTHVAKRQRDETGNTKPSNQPRLSCARNMSSVARGRYRVRSKWDYTRRASTRHYVCRICGLHDQYCRGRGMSRDMRRYFAQ